MTFSPLKTSYFILIILLGFISCKQKAGDRLSISKAEKMEYINGLFHSKNINQDSASLYLRAFKEEKILELWASSGRDSASFIYLDSYSFCTSSGSLGPKRKEGDYQIPEGLYHIDRFNPQSRFFLSLGLNYPNKSDKILSDKKRPGSNIFIHGACVSVGCISITDDRIKELYLITEQNYQSKSEKIRVDIFPFKMTKARMAKSKENKNYQFWLQLMPFFSNFEKSFLPTPFIIKSNGQYVPI